MAWIHIDGADHNRFYAGFDDFAGARRGSPNCRTWLERYVQYRVLGNRAPEVAKAFDFGVRQTCLSMMSPGHDSIPNDEHGAHGRVRARVAHPFGRFRQRGPHEAYIILGGRHEEMNIRRFAFSANYDDVAQSGARQAKENYFFLIDHVPVAIRKAANREVRGLFCLDRQSSTFSAWRIHRAGLT